MSEQKFRYGTFEWWLELQRRWNDDPENIKTLRGLGPVIYVVTDRDELKPIYVDWDKDGKATNIRYAEPEELKTIRVKASAPLQLWKDLFTGKVSSTMAIMGRKGFKIDGPLSVGLKYKKGVDRTLKVGGQIPTEW